MSRTSVPQLDFRPHRPFAALKPWIRRQLWRHRCWIAVTWNCPDERELDAQIDDMASRLFTCWLHLAGSDRTASVAQARINLRAFLDRRDFSADALNRLDPATWAFIATRYPGGGYALIGAENPDHALVEQAVRDAIDSFGTPRRGRSRNSDSIALRQFALLVARYYWAATGKPPSRVVDPMTKAESGRFVEFAEIVWSLVPRRLRLRTDGFARTPRHFIRVAIEEFDRSEAAATKAEADGRITIDETRRWYIEPERWLGSSQGN